MSDCLFDAEELEKMEQGRSVNVSNASKKKLSYNQRIFNRLTRSIQEWQERIHKETKKYDCLLEYYHQEMGELKTEVARHQLGHARILDDCAKTMRFTPQQRGKIAIMITELCYEAFSAITPSDGDQALYEQWSKIIEPEESDTSEDLAKDILADVLHSIHGVRVDPGDFETIDEWLEEYHARILEKSQEEKEKNADFGEPGKRKPRKKSQRQLEAEVLRQEAEKAELKNMRALYLSLAKALHPDMETDPLRKLEKEELMKKITSAWKERNLHELLRLELEWAMSENENLEALADDKQKLYNAALKEQVSELEEEFYSISRHARYWPLHPYIGMGESEMKMSVKRKALKYQQIIENLEKIESEIMADRSKRKIVALIHEYFNFRKVFDRIPPIELL